MFNLKVFSPTSIHTYNAKSLTINAHTMGDLSYPYKKRKPTLENVAYCVIFIYLLHLLVKYQ